MKKHTFRLHTLGACIAVLLTGCGGGSDGSSPSPVPPSPPTPTVKMLAMDGFSVVKPGVRSQVDVANFVRGDQIQLSDATVTGKGCGQPGISGLGLTLTAQQGAHCDYQYTAKQAGSPSTRVHLQVLATSASQPLLPPISGAMTLDDDAKAFDVAALLGSDWQTGDAIVADSVSVQGMQDNEGKATVNSDGTEITFTPPELAGWNRVVFTVKNSQSGDDKLGVIYITFSDVANEAPTIAQPKYDINANNPAITARSGESLTLDLSQLKDLGITDPNGGDWQLLEVKSFTADVSPADKDAITNKAFTFSAGTVGDHYISYIVADEYNGFTSGLLKLHVAPNEHPAGWSSLVDGNKHTFTAPALYSEVDAQGYKVNSVWDNTVSNTLAGFDAKSGNLYCQSMGVLPTLSDLEKFRQFHINDDGLDEDLSKWPFGNDYLVSDNGVIKVFDMQSGITDVYKSDTSYIVTCMKRADISLDMITQKVVANNQWVDLASLKLQNSDTKDIELIKEGGTLELNDVNLQLNKKSDEEYTVRTLSSKIGLFSFKVYDHDDTDIQLTSPVVEYVADLNSMDFRGKDAGYEIVSNFAKSDGNFVNIIKATVKDGNNNPVKDVDVNIDVLSQASETFKLVPESHKTDNNGEVLLKFTDTVPERVQLRGTITRPNGNVVTSSSREIVFYDRQSGGYPCDDGSYKCLPVVHDKQNPDILYTPEASLEFGKTINFNRDVHVSGQGMNDGLPDFIALRLTFAQGAEFCKALADNQYYGRKDWQMVEAKPFSNLIKDYDYEFVKSYNWPNYQGYFTKTPYVDLETEFYRVRQATGEIYRFGDHNSEDAVPCVSYTP
ncbi:hypothetical protein SKA34_08403 [Photobacterium sp. SKA34]|nr:hypothetical protein SKA34_08403 [Photobacterium sp. SKA34]